MFWPAEYRGPRTYAVTDTTHKPADTEDEAPTTGRGPGLVLVYAAGAPVLKILPLDGAGGTPLELGRTHPLLVDHEDALMSRRHARILFRDGGFELTDVGSANGSAVDGRPLAGTLWTDSARVLRLGHSLFLLTSDIAPFMSLGVRADASKERIEGPALQRLLRSVARLAERSHTMYIVGESGSGKESVARAFHSAGPRGPFVAVNCATIPEGVAERLLFGAVKGAFSGAAADSEGYVQAAHGGTLFLDEIADLDATVQAKLLRVLESGEVTPLGSTRPRPVDLRICSASHKDLRELATNGKFRADLYFRIGMPRVVVPPLRQRPEEIPWHVVRTIAKVAPELKASALLVETCLLRTWPGNVRELMAEIKTAAVNALAAGKTSVSSNHMERHAGAALGASTASSDALDEALPKPDALTPPQVQPSTPIPSTPIPSAPRAASPPLEEAPAGRPAFTRTQLMTALIEAKGNISAAARGLGLHRTQLRRYLTQQGIDPDRLKASW